GLSAKFCPLGKTAGRPRRRRVRCAPRLWAVVLGWAHGVGRLRRTPSHSRAARAALLALGYRQMRGGSSRVYRTGSLALLGTHRVSAHELGVFAQDTRSRRYTGRAHGSYAAHAGTASA